eukprot:TRINITY_DN10318_c0_g3_i1.p1 TRINITY_DN10318_c0_g3~~TRINITY_DN10318_c0_g3_i1.p1  ORF type:complete len:302 (+),score=92.61 TRINITY_DN10318_c0_g3_i1:66-971(+)
MMMLSHATLSYGVPDALIPAQRFESAESCRSACSNDALSFCGEVSATSLCTAVGDTPPLTPPSAFLPVGAEKAEKLEPEAGSWCNFLLSSRCRPTHACCEYLHLDSYLQSSADRRTALPSVLTRHVKMLWTELSKMLFATGEAVLAAWYVNHAWGCAPQRLEDVSPLEEVAKQLRAFGWVLPDRSHEKLTSKKVSEAPYASDVEAVCSLVANCMHFDADGSPPIMIRTLEWILNLNQPPVPPLAVESLSKTDFLAGFVDAPKEDTGIPTLLDDNAGGDCSSLLQRKKKRRFTNQQRHAVRM